MVYDPVDSEYYRKAARVLHTLRYAVLLLLIGLLILGFTAYKREITLENFRYIMRYVDLDLSGDAMQANQIRYTTDEDTRFGFVKGDLILLTKKRFTTYDFSGKTLVSEKLAYLEPALKTSGKYALAYDVAGTGLSLYNSYSCLYAGSFAYGVKDADVGSDGSFAVATSGKYLSSRVVVYDADLTDIFTWDTRDKEVTAVALPDSKKTVDFVTLRVDGGDFVLELFSYDTGSGALLFQNTYGGEFPLRLYACRDALCLLTDRNLYFLSPSGEEIARFAHGEDTLTGFYESGDYVALTYAKSILNNSTVQIYTKKGERVTSDKFEQNIIGFASHGNTLYALEKGKLHIRRVDQTTNTLEYKNVSELEIDSLYCGVFAANANEYVLVSPVGAGKFD